MTANDRIKELRINNGWTQQELADKLGFKSKVTISRFENGSRELTRSKIMAFAQVFEVDPTYIMFGDDYFEEEKKPVTEKQQALIDLAMELTDKECELMCKLIFDILSHRYSEE